MRLAYNAQAPRRDGRAVDCSGLENRQAASSRLQGSNPCPSAKFWRAPLADAADIEFMQLALDEARAAGEMGEVPIGAVVTLDGQLVATGRNRRETDRDPAAHAEFIAIRAAASALGHWRLEGACVYVTLEPCIMCAGLMHQARVERCVFGAADPKAGALGTLYSIHADSRLNHRFSVEGGVLADESAELLRSFFSKLR